MALILLTIFWASCLQLSDCLTLHIEGHKTNFHVRLGERSEIKFYVQNSGRDTGKKLIYVMHKAFNTTTFNTKCIVSHWKGKCNSSNNICLCLGETAEGSAFSLNKIFLQSDNGLWDFKLWKHADSPVHVTVLDLASSSNWSVISTLSSNQSGAKESDMDQLSSNKTASTAIIVISLITIVIAITAVITIWQCPKFLTRILLQFPAKKDICIKTFHEREVDNEGEQLQSQERQPEQLLSRGQSSGDEERRNLVGTTDPKPYKHYTFTRSFKKVANLITRKSSDEADDTLTTTSNIVTATTDPTTTVTSTSTFTAATDDGDNIYMNASHQEHAPS